MNKIQKSKLLSFFTIEKRLQTFGQNKKEMFCISKTVILIQSERGSKHVSSFYGLDKNVCKYSDKMKRTFFICRRWKRYALVLAWVPICFTTRYY